MTYQQASQTANEVLSLYRQFGDEDYIGEPVSQIEHMCQCAQLAEAAGYEEDVILAAFLHDVGHLCQHILPVGNMEGYGATDHETIGAAWLQTKGFSLQLTKLVASHVPAKRYLTFQFPDYYNQLSEASKKTLEYQGGMMSQEEALVFQKDPLSTLYIALRRWDEQAKEMNVPLPSLEHYERMMIRHLLANSGHAISSLQEPPVSIE